MLEATTLAIKGEMSHDVIILATPLAYDQSTALLKIQLEKNFEIL